MAQEARANQAIVSLASIMHTGMLEVFCLFV